ncbi:MAG: hypothetical protein JO341_04990 [Gammaproteobacteria bacterium]|nr:hypothetical protein [Gammaproteobacteria bacterium]MBV9620360.1 hypothetical protein [Gammaproteobacteria bacterium]
MREVLRLFVQIALLRRGPQDLPASLWLLVPSVLLYIALNVLLGALLPLNRPGHAAPSGSWAALLLDTLFTYVWYAVLLRLAGRPERTLQTTTAVFGLLIVLTPLLFLSGWLWSRLAEDAVWGAPLTLFGVVLLVWLVAANARILKAALEWSGSVCVALVILQIVVAELLRRALFALPEG